MHAGDFFSLFYFRAPKASVSASLVKQLRDETWAGMMACKKALAETEGDLEKALEYLRKKSSKNWLMI